MSEIKIREHLKNSSGSYDAVFRETLAEIVLNNKGGSVQDHIDALMTAADGAHGFRWNAGDETFEVYDPVEDVWIPVSPVTAEEIEVIRADILTKADRVVDAVPDNIAMLDEHGSLVDSGSSVQDILSSANSGKPEYGTCTTPAATAAKEVTLDNANWVRQVGSMLIISHTYSVPANATLNANATGAGQVRLAGARIGVGVIGDDSVVTYVWTGTYWYVLSIDRSIDVANVTAGSATAYTMVAPHFALVDGAVVRAKLHVASGASATINVGSKGARSIQTMAGKPMPTGIPANTWITLVYSLSNTSFILQGDTGGSSLRYGNAPGQISHFELMIFGNWRHDYGRSFR